MNKHYQNQAHKKSDTDSMMARKHLDIAQAWAVTFKVYIHTILVKCVTIPQLDWPPHSPLPWLLCHWLGQVGNFLICINGFNSTIHKTCSIYTIIDWKAFIAQTKRIMHLSIFLGLTCMGQYMHLQHHKHTWQSGMVKCAQYPKS